MKLVIIHAAFLRYDACDGQEQCCILTESWTEALSGLYAGLCYGCVLLKVECCEAFKLFVSMSVGMKVQAAD
jgi:hypothetical protein